MSDLLIRLAGLLRELDEIRSLNAPVLIDKDLIPLIKKHGHLHTVTLVPVRARRVAGMHLGNVKEGRAVIIYQRCELHYATDPSPGCPGCQTARFEMAKELAHALDGDHEKTSPDEAADKLLALVIKSAWHGPEAYADGMGGMCALELLVRFRQRRSLLGGPGLNPSLRLQMARANDNYSELATQFGVPPYMLKHAFSDDYMAAMMSWRSVHGLSNELPAWD